MPKNNERSLPSRFPGVDVGSDAFYTLSAGEYLKHVLKDDLSSNSGPINDIRAAIRMRNLPRLLQALDSLHYAGYEADRISFYLRYSKAVDWTRLQTQLVLSEDPSERRVPRLIEHHSPSEIVQRLVTDNPRLTEMDPGYKLKLIAILEKKPHDWMHRIQDIYLDRQLFTGGWELVFLLTTGEEKRLTPAMLQELTPPDGTWS